MHGHESQIVLANLATVAAPRILIVGLWGTTVRDALAGRGCDVTIFQNDVRAAPDAIVAAWLEPAEPFDAVLVALPRETSRLRMWLAMAAATARAGATVYLVGHNDAGARSAGKDLAAVVGDARTVDTRYHCRLMAADVDAPRPAALEDHRVEFDAADLRVVSYPGVFSHGKLDEGTRLLLSTFDGSERGRALDVGCGSGVLATALARAGLDVEAVDADALAVRATGETLDRNGVTAHVHTSDLFADVEGRFSLVVSNPPFHAGRKTLTGVGRRLIEDARDRLERKGELRIVANRFLPYRDPLGAAFSHVEVLAADRSYTVYRARV